MKRKISVLLCILLVTGCVFSSASVSFAQPAEIEIPQIEASKSGNGTDDGAADAAKEEGAAEKSKDAENGNDSENGQPDPDDPFPVADAAILMDARTGEILFQKNPDRREYPASMTKVLTALLAIENCKLDQVVTISAEAAATEGSKAGFIEGEEVTVEELLYALMLQSANDAAIAIAETVSGSIEAFADLMNSRAAELGADNSHFVTPNGLHDDEHYTTVMDMTKFARKAMKNSTFRDIVSTPEYEMRATNKNEEKRKFVNTNKLLSDENYRYPGIKGIKTGFTSKAQGCLVAQAERDDVDVIAVIMHSDHEQLFNNMTGLLNYAFDNYTGLNILSKGRIKETAKVKGGSDKTVALKLKEAVNGTVIMKNDGTTDYTAEDFTYKIDVPELEAPVKKDSKVGKLTLYREDRAMSTYSLYTAEDVELSFFRKIMEKSSVPVIPIAVAVVAVIAAAVYIGIMISAKKRRQAARKKKQAMKAKRRMDMAQHDDGYGYGNRDYGYRDDGYGYGDRDYGYRDDGYGYGDRDYGYRDDGYGYEKRDYDCREIRFDDRIDRRDRNSRSDRNSRNDR